MADYKGIQGYTVQSLASDPPASIGLGQLWYNSASNVWKIGAVGAGAWASGNNRNTEIYDGMGCGTTTAALTALGSGGTGSPTTPPGNQLTAETYDGTSWAVANAAPTAARVVGGGGIQTSAIVAGGYAISGYYTESFTFDGTNWTEVADINFSREGLGGAASTATAALICGGSGPNASPPRTRADTETYDGTCWTQVNDMQVAKYNTSTLGTSTACIAVGGFTGSTVATNEEWDGTCWSEEGDLNDARQSLAGQATGIGTITAAIVTAGNPPAPATVSVQTESYDGTTWTSVADLATARSNSMAAGIQTSGMISGGNISGTPHTNATELWDGAPQAVQTVTTS